MFEIASFFGSFFPYFLTKFGLHISPSGQLMLDFSTVEQIHCGLVPHCCITKKFSLFIHFRPLFTWWVTLVQVLVCIVSLVFYGLGPAGWERVEMKDEVIDVSLVLRQVSYYEPVNLWIGPRFVRNLQLFLRI